MTHIPEGITLQKLAKEGCEFSVPLDPETETDVNKEEELNVQSEMMNYLNLNCLGGDDQTYEETEPFEKIAEGMKSIYDDGKIKKRILRDGYGELPPKNAIVKIDYNAYIEYSAEPFDSTYARKRRHEFILQNGEVLPGLDMAVASMKLNEKSQFLVAPELAYGKLGCLGRIGPDATILFEIELHQIVDSGAAHSFSSLPEEEQNNFENVFKYCLSLCNVARDKFKRNIKDAIYNYNQAVSKLENFVLNDYSQQEKQQDLLLRLHQNLLVCYTKNNEPKKGCMTATRIYRIVDGTTVKLPAKVYFCHAKCLRSLGEYQHAQRKLRQAQKLEPKNPDICNEYVLLQEQIDKHKQSEQKMAQAFVKNLK